ncbi:EAL domain-containing protein [Paenibacillus sp. LHD-117]|uniref:EAL domain-containing protein n=1 Tax=Paenibacillus sp. LHD-117 TaxID=3071412 RepID=UPI0027DF1544|nr:EAL domain-containing protein [Paenibacillus sp. LHD-117]MDQ6418385.1 EAL domain-containing protein [Paenibacillus sp. LHD-117]
MERIRRGTRANVIERRMIEDWIHNRKLELDGSNLGVIYMSWDSWKGHGYEGLLYAQPDLSTSWRSFAECEAERIFHASLLQTALHWRNNDLFISIKLPLGKRHALENWLMELALDVKGQWEQRFLEKHGVACGNLRAGVSVTESQGEWDNESYWYEAVKNAILQGQSDINLERSIKRRAFSRIVAERTLYPVYQPIVSLRGGEIFGYEALTRLKDRSLFDGPLDLFDFAEKEGQVYALDRVARGLAIDGCVKLKEGQKLFINVMAQIMEDPGFSPGETISLLEQHRLSPHHVVFEITERSAIADYPAVKKALQHYRNQGYQIAIDDVGAGYSSLQSIVELNPDFLKVDRSIVQGIHQNEMKEHVMGTLIDIGGKMGVSLIAEGIESEEELRKLGEMGVHYAQGYLIGRPEPFPKENG